MRIHDFSHISHILTSTERFMKKLLILLLGLLLLQISYSRSVLIPKNRPELVISKIYNPSSGKILVIYQCKDWLNRVTNSFAAPEFMIRIGSTIMSLSAADYDWPVSTDGSEWVKVTDLNDMPLTAGTKSPYVQQIRITADVNPQTELRPATVTFFSTDQTQTATVSVTQEAAGPAFPCQWIFSASTVGQYNSSWSASNMLPSTLGSSGYISVVRDDANAGREFTRTVSSYKPTVSTMVEGDYWLYTLPVKRLEAGTAVEFDATMAGETNSPKYFIVEYLDRGVWKSIEEDLLTAPAAPSLRYSYKCSDMATGANYQHASIMQTIRFTDPVEGAVHPLLHRGTLHLRGRHAEHLGEPAAALWVLRLLCPEPRHGGPGRHEKGALPRQLVLLLQQPGVDAQRDRLERRPLSQCQGAFQGFAEFRTAVGAVVLDRRHRHRRLRLRLHSGPEPESRDLRTRRHGVNSCQLHGIGGQNSGEIGLLQSHSRTDLDLLGQQLRRIHRLRDFRKLQCQGCTCHGKSRRNVDIADRRSVPYRARRLFGHQPLPHRQ